MGKASKKDVRGDSTLKRTQKNAEKFLDASQIAVVRGKETARSSNPYLERYSVN
jgi:hypothetical protein